MGPELTHYMLKKLVAKNRFFIVIVSSIVCFNLYKARVERRDNYLLWVVASIG